jgi:hypothetical protein
MKKIFLGAKQMHAMMMTTHFIYLTSMGCYRPYIVTEVIPGGAYRLQDKKTGKDESNPWNAEQLRCFYA